MIHLKFWRLLVFLFVFFFSFIISSLIYYYTRIDLFQDDLHKIDIQLSGKEFNYIDKEDNKQIVYFSNWLSKDIFENLHLKKPIVYLSELYGNNLIKYLENFDKYCIDYNSIGSCTLDSLIDIKQRYYSFSSFLTDIHLFKSLWISLEKDICYILDPKKYYIQENEVYSIDTETNTIYLEFIKRNDKNRRTPWKEVSKELNKIKQKILLNKINNLNYYLRYKKCEQSGKINSI